MCLLLSTLNHPPLLLNMLKMFKATTCLTSHGMEHVIGKLAIFSTIIMINITISIIITIAALLGFL